MGDPLITTPNLGEILQSRCNRLRALIGLTEQAIRASKGGHASLVLGEAVENAIFEMELGFDTASIDRDLEVRSLSTEAILLIALIAWTIDRLGAIQTALDSALTIVRFPDISR